MGLRALGSLFLLLSVLATACDGSVDSPGSGGASASGAGTSGGDGGAGPCGGIGGLACGPDQYCAYDGGSCGEGDGLGTCAPRPEGACPPDCPGICGCDGQFYCSECAAHAAGMDVGANIPCAEGDPERRRGPPRWTTSAPQE